MTSAREVEELIARIDVTPYGPEERELIREALVMTAELDDPDLEYRLRMRQTSSSFMAGDAETMLTSFPWCIAWHDVDPGRFPHQIDNQDLLWQFKWMSDLLMINPRFSLAQVNEVCDDMERRYTAAGVGLSGVWQARFSNAARSGHHDQARVFRQRRDENPVDEYSHCQACLRSEDAAWLFETGEQQEALRIFDEIIAGGFTCGEEPERAQGQALLWLLRANRFDDAITHHRLSLRFAKASPDPLPLILPHLPFLAITGNLASAFALLEEYLPLWASDAINLALRHRAALCFGVVLDLIISADLGDIPVRGSEDPALEGVLGRREQLLTAAQLARRCWRIADELADDFDERNGTDRFNILNQAARELRSEHYDLPLGGPIPLEIHAPSPAPRTAFDHLATAQLKKYLTDDQRGARESLSLALELADENLAVDVLGEFASLADGLDPEQARSHEDAYLVALETLGRGAEVAFLRDFGLRADPDGPADFSPYDSDPDERVRHRVLARRLELAHQAGNMLLVEQLYPQVVSTNHPDLAHSVARVRVHHEYTLLETNPAQVVASAAELSNVQWPWIAFFHSNMVASIHRRAGRPADGMLWAEKALEIATRYGVRPLIAKSADLLSDLLAAQGKLAEAVNTQRIAVRQNQLAGAEDDTNYRMKLGHLLAATSRGSEAADEFEAVARLEKARGSGPSELAVDYLCLARAVQADDPNRAYLGFKQALEQALLAENSRLVVETSITFGQFLAFHNDPDAVEMIQSALPHLESSPEMSGAFHHALGQARFVFGDQDALRDLDRALAIAEETGNSAAQAEVIGSIGQAMIHFGRLDEGVKQLCESAALFTAAEAHLPAALAELSAARALITVGRADEANTLLGSARNRLATEPLILNQITADFADHFEESGRGELADLLRAQLPGAELT